MNNLFRKVIAVVSDVLGIVVALFFFAMFLKLVLEPLAPVVTFLVVLIATVNTFDKWTTAISSVAGIILYAASWYVFAKWGYWCSMSFWSAGILIWFAAVLWPFLKSKHYSPDREVVA